MRVKIPPVDVALVGASATVVATSVVRSTLGDASVLARTQPMLAALVATALVAPMAFVSLLLWKGSELRATNWRRVAAKITAILLGAFALASSLAGLSDSPLTVVLAPRVTGVIAVALLALAAMVFATSPARQMPRPPRKR